MPIHYVIDKERLVISTAWGVVTFAEARAHQSQLASDPDFNRDFNQIIDTTAVTKLDLSADEAEMLARRALFSPGSRRAFVATDPDIFEMGRLMGIYHDIARTQEQTCVFYDLDAALKWLGLEPLPR